MGPTIIFDKSFLQSLSLDESVWLDNFFLTNITPIFYIEALADISKNKKNRDAKKEVSILADKTPEMHPHVNIFHCDLYVQNLLGKEIVMNGQVIIAENKRKQTTGNSGVFVEIPPEIESFERWHKREFTSLEIDFARKWRIFLNNVNFSDWISYLNDKGITPKSCTSFDQANEIVNKLIYSYYNKDSVMQLALNIFIIPREIQEKIYLRWNLLNNPPLHEYAPYANYVLKLELFYYVLIASNLEPPNKISSKMDIAYLYYLPFCMTFISSDKFHEKCIKYFLRDNQRFIWGQDLKNDLKNLNKYYDELPDFEKNEGIYSFATYPPKDEDFLVSEIWDFHFKQWRDKKYEPPKLTDELRKKIKQMMDQQDKAGNEPFFSVKRKVRRKKGSWKMYSDDIK